MAMILKSLNKHVFVTLILMALTALPLTANEAYLSERAMDRVQNEVRKELVMLPFYSVFDHFEYQVSRDGELTLMGQVIRPTLKDAAERVTKDIEGIRSIRNQIEVLPLSPQDDRIRLQTFRALYSQPALQQLSVRAIPTIHIIVKRGDITLEGYVNNEVQKRVAEITAQQIPGTFKVTNNLLVDGDSDDS
jgi:hyperosmotically inducible protein